MTNLVLTVNECAKTLKVSEEDVLLLIKKNMLLARQIGTDYRIPMHSIHTYLETPATAMDFSNIQTLLETLVMRSEAPELPQILIHDILEDVLALKERYVSSNTFEWLCGVGKHIDTHLGNEYIADLTPKKIQQFYSVVSVNKHGDAISKRFMLGISGLLGQIIQYALDNKYLAESPITTSVSIPPCSQPDPHARFLDYDEINLLLEAAHNSLFYTTLIRLLVMSGLRISEAMGLYWSDIDFENQIIHVRRAVIKTCKRTPANVSRAYYVIGNTKTPQSIRDVPVVSEVLSLLRAWKFHVYAQDSWIVKIKEQKNQHLIFPNKFGMIHDLHTLHRSFKLFISRSGHDFSKVTFHRLRHSYGSFLLEQGEELVTISRLLGHKSIRVTADIYCTVTHRLKLQAATKTQVIWNNLQCLN